MSALSAGSVVNQKIKTQKMMQFLIDNSLLLAVIVVAAAGLALPALNRKRFGPEVGPAEATQLINRHNAQIVDVRKAAEFKKGHIPNSINLPATDIQNAIGQLEKNRPVLLVDQTGGGSRPIAKLLRGVGFNEVYILEHGLLGWRQAKMPLE